MGGNSGGGTHVTHVRASIREALQVESYDNSSARVALMVFGVERGFLSTEGWGAISAASTAQHVVEPLVSAGAVVAGFMCLDARPDATTELPVSLRQRLHIVHFSRRHVSDSIIRRQLCFDEVEEFERINAMSFTHVYFTRTELAWYRDAPLPAKVTDSILLRARRLRSADNSLPLSMEHFAHPLSAATCGFETYTYQHTSFGGPCTQDCVFMDDQLAAAPRHLAAALARPRANMCDNQMHSADTRMSYASLRLAGPLWSSRSAECTRCGFKSFWNEAKLTQPLLQTGCAFKLHPFGAILTRSDPYYNNPAMSFANTGVLVTDLHLARNFDKASNADLWNATTKQQFQWASGIRANAQIMC
jgi:hypothetical protein